MIKIQGHRGFSELYPENTMISFQKCYESGASAIEMDIWNTSDGEFVILHDMTIDRTSDGTGNVTAMTLSQLKTYDFGSWFHTDFAGEKIPTLDEVLTEYQDKNITLVLHCYVISPSMLSQIVDKVVSYGMIDKVQFFGSMAYINTIKSYNPSAFTLNAEQPTIGNYQSYLDNAVAYGHNAVSIYANAPLNDLQIMIGAIKAQNKLVHASYVGSDYQTSLQKHIDLGTDFLLGNNPLIMQTYLDENYGEENEYSQSAVFLNNGYGKIKYNTYVKNGNNYIRVKFYKKV